LGSTGVDITAWLRELGLEQYEEAFRDNAINGEILPKLTADDVKEIGVTVVGHRRKMIEAIAGLDARDGRMNPSTAGTQIAPAPRPQSAPPSIQAERRADAVATASSSDRRR
jgi:hypothetical protein